VNFAQANDYLLSLGNEVAAMKLGLDAILTLLAALGDPQRKYLKVQVAGTNGKGSVCAFLNSICLHAGIRTGMFTSPHLVSVTERVQVGGEQIGEEEFANLATRVRIVSEKLVADGELDNVPTYFEQVTAIALLAFAETGVELAILETGLGGRLDAVTAADAEIAAITRIDLDHQEYLGNTIEKIASEKAAIIRPDSRVVIGPQSEKAMSVILGRCRDAGVEPQVAEDVSVVEAPDSAGRQWVVLQSEQAHMPALSFPRVRLGLAGRHQVENAAIALLLAKELDGFLNVGTEAIAAGLETARHPGRLEWKGRYLLDGAHNAAGAKVLSEYLEEHVSGPITLIFGAMKGKDVAAMANSIWPRANRIILTKPRNSRATPAAELASFAPGYIDREKIILTVSAAEALAKADAIRHGDPVVLVTGSLYLVGEVREILNNREV
jgi:dihydrofolate synthase / folylpolyglutamate synthase